MYEDNKIPHNLAYAPTKHRYSLLGEEVFSPRRLYKADSDSTIVKKDEMEIRLFDRVPLFHTTLSPDLDYIDRPEPNLTGKIYNRRHECDIDIQYYRLR